MKIEPFGEIKYYEKDKHWFGRLKGIVPDVDTEICIETNNEKDDIPEQIELVKNFISDKESIEAILFLYLFKKHKEYGNTEISLEKLTTMYFLTNITLKSDRITWWVTLEPDFNVETIYNHFRRFTIKNKEIIWANI